MKLVPAVAATMVLVAACRPAAEADPPVFYVLDLAGEGAAVAYTRGVRLPKSDLPYVMLESTQVDCCFRSGARPSASEAPAANPDVVRDLTSEEDVETFQSPGYVAAPPAARKRADELGLGFGLEGMTAVAAAGKQAYAITLADRAKPLFLRYCHGTEGINLALYRSLADKAPYASYYFYLGYELEPDCG